MDYQRLQAYRAAKKAWGLGQMDFLSFGAPAGCTPSRANTCSTVDSSGRSVCYDSRGCPTASTDVKTGATTSLVDPSKATAEQKQILTDFSKNSPADSGVSAAAVGNVLTGVGAILAPLAQAGVGIYQSQQMASLEKSRLKASQNQPAYNPGYFPAAAVPASSNTPVIIAAVVGGLVVVGGLIFALSK